MTERELKRLSRSDLVEMLMEQTTRVRELEDQLEDANRILERRDIAIDEAGSIAEAALKLNGVFEAAQAAGEQYLENIRTLSERQEALCARREEESMKRAEKILEKACHYRLAQSNGRGGYRLTPEGFLVSNSILSDLLVAQETSETIGTRL